MARKKVEIYDEVITPERAEQILGKNEHNRRVTSNYLAILCGAIERGEWKFNGDTIRIDTNGQVLDGQHRLMAIIKTGKKMRQIVVVNLPPDVFDTIDTGKRRNFADILSTQGVDRYVHETSAALRKIDRIMNFGGNSPKRTNVEMEGLFKEYPDLFDHVVHCRVAPRHVMPQSAFAALRCLFSRIDKAGAQSFIEALMVGDAPKKSAIHILREQMIRNKTGHSRMRDRAMLAICIDAWHYWNANEIPNINRFLIPDEFPVIIGLEPDE